MIIILLAELTTTARVGFHQYTFPKTDSAHIILDLMSGIYNYPDKNVWTFIRVENDSLLPAIGKRAAGHERALYISPCNFPNLFIEYGNKNFSKPEPYRGFWGKFDQSKNFPELAGKQIRMYFNFKTNEGEKIKIKFALSPVSTENALDNLHVKYQVGILKK